MPLLRQLNSIAQNTSSRTFIPSTAYTKTNNGVGTCALCQVRLFSSNTGLYPRTTTTTTTTHSNRRNITTSNNSNNNTNANDNDNITEKPLQEIPDITTYYTIFSRIIPKEPPPKSPFEIPTIPLRQEFLRLQSQIHPDKYPTGNARTHAEALSSRINEAYYTLLDPLSRAQYILREFHGIDVTAEDAAARHALDQTTLMEVMEVQETVEEVANSGMGVDQAEGVINGLKGENKNRIGKCVLDLGGAFDRNDLEGARKETIRLRFWYSLGQGLNEWEPGMEEIRLVH